MDPNSNIEEQRRLAARIVAANDADNEPDPLDVMRLADLVITLDGWLCSGGFLPRTWERN